MGTSPRGPNAVVDVGIPAYRRPEYIVEAIESVLAQTFGVWSLTISEDGGGNDAVREAVRPYLGDSRVTYRAMPERVGQSANWTSLIGSGTAPYVALLHDDDRWQPGFLERRVSFLDEHPECGLVFSRTREIDATGHTIGLSPHRHREGVIAPEELIPRLIRTNVIGHPPSILVRRTAYETVGAAFRTVIFQDYEMWYRIALHFPVGYLDICDADYRRHADSMTTAEYSQSVLPRNLRLVDELIAMTAAVCPGLLSRREAGRAYSSIALALALEDLCESNVRSSVRALGSAISRYPPAVIDRRVGAWTLALLSGSTGRQLLARARAARATSAPAG
jgi:glycosyltransferase involved in cell wall biosynthesis